MTDKFTFSRAVYLGPFLFLSDVYEMACNALAFAEAFAMLLAGML